MILTKLLIRNVRRYVGEQTIEFPQPNMNQHVHLVGGKNGVGKTTMFHAIQACLFASQSNPMLRARDISLTQPAPSEMGVEIEFEQEAQSYVLRRHWARRSSTSEHSVNSVELRSLLQNIDSNDSITNEDDIAEFINSLMPYQTRSLFLFDGEEVQSYIDKASESVKDAIERLLGLHPYIQLQKDVESIRQTMRADRNSYDVNEDLLGKQEAVDRNDVALRSNDRRRAELRRAASEAKTEYAMLEREESRLQGLFDPIVQAERRELESQRDSLQQEIERHETSLASLMPKEAVVTWFWPELFAAIENSSPTMNSFPETVDELANFLFQNRKEISDALITDSVDQLSGTLRNALNVNEDSDVLYSVGDGLNKLVDLIGAGRDDVFSYPEKLKSMRLSLDQIGHEISSLPSAESVNIDVKSLHDQMTAERTKQARHQESLKSLARERERLTEESEDLKKDISRLTEDKQKYRSLSDNIEVCEQILAVLEEFVADYRSTLIADLQKIVNRKFRELTNAPGLIETIQIDGDSVELKLLNRSGELLAEDQSAGQKAILAFTLIASVVELSNRQVPAVVDTPLARLDMLHKKNALSGFFPCLGPQVIILSTDTEIGRDEVEQLSPVLATKHHLQLDAGTGQTDIKDGYFGE